MSLETTHGAYQGTYAKFHRWRKWLAWHIEIDLDKMKGNITSTGVAGQYDWSNVKDDLKILLMQPVGTGSISPEDCKKVAKRLDKISVELNIEEWQLWYNIITKFRDGCRNAHMKGEYLIFK